MQLITSLALRPWLTVLHNVEDVLPVLIFAYDTETLPLQQPLQALSLALVLLTRLSLLL